MASYIKRLRGYIAPIFVVYTIVVTYFLAQRAWDDVNNLLRRRSEVKFLDVLVQEERRHLHSFQDVVKNYRGDKYGDHREEEVNVNNNLPRDVHPREQGNTAHSELETRSQHLYRLENETRISNVSYLPPNDLNLPLEQDALDNGEPRPFFRVEVEEWDATAEQPKQTPKQSNNSLEDSTPSRLEDRAGNNNFQNLYLNSSNFKISNNYHQNTMQPRKDGNVPGDQTYTTEFCDNVLDAFGLKPSICVRDLAETGSSVHVNISSYSLLFRQFGDILIFSAFLDTREQSYTIRLITLGRQGLHSNKSVYWCVFYIRSQLSNSSHRVGTDLNSPASERRQPARQGTQLIYYSASDGHNKNSQFYIMSCPVPDPARTSLLPPYRGLFQIVIGNLQRPFLDRSQESLTLKVITNNPGAIDTPLRGEHQKSYFDNMEHDLLTLNLRNVTSKNESIKINSSQNNSKYSQSNTDNKVELDRLSSRNVSEYKIVTCVAPLQGGIGVVQLVEFIELSLLLGSQHVVFYTFHVSEETTRVLYMYVGRGLVTVLPWNIPIPQSVWANGRDMALNDCLYRTMHVYDYALFLDVDEFLVPRATPDIPSFLKYLKAVHKFNSSKFSDLVFSSAYFPPLTKTQHKNLTTVEGFTRDINKFISLKSVHRTFINPKHTLRLVKLSKALRVGAGERKRTSFTISPRFAFVNHYSYCPPEARVGSRDNGGVKPNSREKNPQDICSRTKQDFIMWRYKTVLIQRVKDSVRRLNTG